jgi:hypothetical protein
MKLIRRLTTALLAAAALVLSSCADPGAPVSAPQIIPPRADLLGGTLGGLLGQTGLVACTPLPADSASAVIGPSGGTISVGPHTFTVPAGALDSAVLITAVAPSDTVNRVQFQPQGLTFRQPALLTMSYANCGVLTVLLPKHIAYIDDALLILDLLSTSNDISAQTITGHLRHFSDYAVAW